MKYRSGQARPAAPTQRCEAICTERSYRKGERCQRYGRFRLFGTGPLYCKQHFEQVVGNDETVSAQA